MSKEKEGGNKKNTFEYKCTKEVWKEMIQRYGEQEREVSHNVEKEWGNYGGN